MGPPRRRQQGGLRPRHAHRQWSDGTQQSATYRNTTFIPAGSGATQLQVGYSNWAIINTAPGEQAGPNPISFKAALEYGGAYYPFTFGGKQTVTLDPWGDVVSDPLGITIPAGAQAWIRTYVSVATLGQKWPMWRSINISDGAGSAGERFVNGSDLSYATGDGGLSYSGNAPMFAPNGLYGVPTNPAVPSVLLVGDSIFAGLGDSTTITSFIAGPGYYGYGEKGLGNAVHWATATRTGDWLEYLAGDHTKRFQRLAPNFTSAIVQQATNDFGGNRTLAQIKADALTVWNDIAARGIAVYACTVTPRATSTDGWTTVAGQSRGEPTQTNIDAYNDWIRSLPAPLRGYFDAADYASTGRNSGIWQVSPNARQVTDGVVTAGNSTITSATASFTSADLGVNVFIPGAGASGGNYTGIINGITSATAVTVSGNPGTTIASGATIKIGARTIDGLHPTTEGANAISAAIATNVGQLK